MVLLLVLVAVDTRVEVRTQVGYYSEIAVFLVVLVLPVVVEPDGVAVRFENLDQLEKLMDDFVRNLMAVVESALSDRLVDLSAVG